MTKTLLAAAVGGAACLAGEASAGALSQAHVALMAHNVALIDSKNADKEDGPSLDAELAFAAPQALRFLGGPRPTLIASLNLAGETSFAGVGVTWRAPLGGGWALEPGLGYVVHDGDIDNAFPQGSPEAERFQEERLLLGSRDLFRVSLGLSRDLGPKGSLGVFYSHLSHGQILGSGRNQGLDQIGVRLGWRFKAESNH